MIQKSPDGAEGDDDKVYFFFTEVSVEYEFVFKLMIPRVARVCKVSASPSPQAQFPPIVPGRCCYSEIPVSGIAVMSFGWKPLAIWFNVQSRRRRWNDDR